jgi:hypothetical protein
LDPKEFGAFFTAILLYSIEIRLGLGVKRELEKSVVFDNFGWNGDGIDRV